MNPGSGGDGWAELFTTAFNRSRNSMLLLSRERVILRANTAFRTHFGYSDDQLVGRATAFLIAPGARPRAQREWETILRRDRVCIQRDMVRSDGSTITVDFAAHRATVDGHDLVLCVLLEHDGQPPTVRGVKTTARDPNELTPREREIVLQIAMGHRLPEIADHLFISTSTVRTHVRNAMRKLGARSQAQLVAIALSEGIVAVDAPTSSI